MPHRPRVGLHHGDDGRVTMRKHFIDGTAARAEARWLAAAQHPGVVRLVARGENTVDTEPVDGSTLARAELDPVAARRVWASVAETVADLHERGLVHGRLEPDHVLVADPATRRPRAVLCSPDPDAVEASVDLEALRFQAARLLEGDSPTRRRAVAEADRPRAVARALTAGLERLDATQSRDEPARRRRQPIRACREHLGWVLVAVATGLAGFGLIGVEGAGTDPATVESDHVASGAHEIELDGRRFRIGSPDDLVVVLPAACRRPPMVAILEPDGLLWQLTGPGVPGEAVATIPGATAMEVRVGAPPTGCPVLRVTGPAGSVTLKLDR